MSDLDWRLQSQFNRSIFYLPLNSVYFLSYGLILAKDCNVVLQLKLKPTGSLNWSWLFANFNGAKAKSGV